MSPLRDTPPPPQPPNRQPPPNIPKTHATTKQHTRNPRPYPNNLITNKPLIPHSFIRHIHRSRSGAGIRRGRSSRGGRNHVRIQAEEDSGAGDADEGGE